MTRGTKIARGVVLASVVVAALGGAVDAAARDAASSPSLDSVILPARNVGTGYVRRTIPGGRGVANQVTLDFCGGAYPSEALRLARFQAAYVRGANEIAFSNEVVRYRSGGAAQALREVERRERTCVRNRPVVGAPDKRYVRLSRLRDPRLPPGAIAMSATIQQNVQGALVRVDVVIVYQRRGNVLSGIYAYGGTEAQRVSQALRLASLSAERLRTGGQPTA
jgi:hypothetical protein